MGICGDNRFEIIAKAKAHLLDATNIDTSEDEMKVLDSFLFRCWQMGWLDRYDTADRKTEPSNSENPNNSTISKMEQVDEPQTKYPCDTCANKGDHDGECSNCVSDSEVIKWKTPSHYKPKDEPQTERSE